MSLHALGPGYIRFDELQQIVRLLGELRELPQGSLEHRLHAIRGLVKLVDAQVGLFLDGTMKPSDASIELVHALDIGWAARKERDVFAVYLAGAQERSVDPSHPRFVRDLVRAKRVTRTRDQLVGDREWYRSEHVNEVRRAAGVDSFIAVGALLNRGRDLIGISLHRPWGDRQLSERERRIVEVLVEEVPWFLQPPPRGPANLTPRLRETLVALAGGLSEKQVADRLGISAHTVHEYTKTLYRHYRVSSRAELLARYLGER